MTVLAVVLAVAMLMGTMTVSAFAEVSYGYKEGNITTDGAAENAGVATFVDKLSYGETTKAFAGAAKLVTPGGVVYDTKDADTAKADAAKTKLANFKAEEIGIYTVYYGEKSEYSYTVSCTLDEEYELRVDHSGADIPTYVQTGKEFTLPKASVWAQVKDKDGEYTEKRTEGNFDAGFEVFAKVVGVKDSEASAKDARTFKLDQPGTYTVHYYCKVEGGTKYLFKDYTVKVQSTFNDSTAPKLTIVSLSKEISLNTKVTLPKATVTDNYDDNVRIDIKVEELGADGTYSDVQKVEVDENGYAVKKLGVPEVFENNYNLSFYPMEATTYRVSYVAKDDNGNETTTHNSYTVKAVDKSAPVLKEIDDENIPTKYGVKSVTRGKNEGETVDGDTVKTENPVINFPYPEYVDNSGKDENDVYNKISVSFEIKDTVNNQTVLKISNIYAKANEDGTTATAAKYTYDANLSTNGLYPEDAEFVTDENTGKKVLPVSFYKYAEKLGEGKTYTGTYTVTYRASDGTNSTSKTYDIDLVDDFTDTDEAAIKVSFTDDYLVATTTEKDFVVPTPVITDDTDTRPLVTYTLKGKTDADVLTVKGGEKVKIYLDGGNNAFMKLDDKTIALGDTLAYEIVVTDDAGNVKKESGSVQIVNASAMTMTKDTLAFNGDGLLKHADMVDDKILKPGVDINLGEFSFAVNSDQREFYGFELSLVKDGELWSAGKISLDTYYAKTNPNDATDTAGRVVVKNITVAPPAIESDFALYIRVFNAAGMSFTTKMDINVDKPDPDDDDKLSAAEIPTTGNVYTTYTLKNKELTKPGDLTTNVNEQYIIRQISGKGKFSLMGTQFTAYNAGTFTFVDAYINQSGHTVPFAKNPGYTLTVTDGGTPAWQVQGEMPSYSPLNEKVTLPKVVASSAYANAAIDLAITDPKSNSLKIASSVADNTGKDVTIDENGNYVFTPDKDGSYTITYTARYGNNEQITQSFTMKAGDFIAPVFTVDSTPPTRATENDKFTFSAVTLGDDDKANVSTTRFVKTLKAPDGSTVYTVDGTGNAYRIATTPTDNTSAYTFTKTGIYTVEYVTYDEANNSSIMSYTISVTAAKVNNPVSTKIISTILIIVGVLLIAGVILYFVRFRKVKSK